MKAIDFQLIDDERNDNSVNKRELLEIYHQNGQEVNEENQGIKFFLGETLNYIQVGNVYLEIDIKIGKSDNINFIVAADNTKEVSRIVNFAFAYFIP